MANLNKIDVDFQVLKTHDPRLLILADTSQWSNILDKPAVIEITSPGSNAPSVEYWAQGKINVFNGQHLGIVCGVKCEDNLPDLPDGIYRIVLKGSPDKFYKERYYLRTEKLQLNLDKVYISFGLNLEYADFESVEKIWNVKLLIESAEAHTRKGEMGMASDLYKQAKRIVDSHLNCQDCR